MKLKDGNFRIVVISLGNLIFIAELWNTERVCFLAQEICRSWRVSDDDLCTFSIVWRKKRGNCSLST